MICLKLCKFNSLLLLFVFCFCVGVCLCMSLYKWIKFCNIVIPLDKPRCLWGKQWQTCLNNNKKINLTHHQTEIKNFFSCITMEFLPFLHHFHPGRFPSLIHSWIRQCESFNPLVTCSFSLDSNPACLNYFSDVNLKPFTVTVSLTRTPSTASVTVETTMDRLVQTVVTGRWCYPIIRDYSGISNTNRIHKAICKNGFVVMIEFKFNQKTREYWMLSFLYSNCKVK